MTLPKLRFPSWGEIWSLFVGATHVDQLVASIERQAKALEAVVAHQVALADKHIQRAADLHCAAYDFQDKAEVAKAEAERAARVSGKFSALIA